MDSLPNSSIVKNIFDQLILSYLYMVYHDNFQIFLEIRKDKIKIAYQCFKSVLNRVQSLPIIFSSLSIFYSISFTLSFISLWFLLKLSNIFCIDSYFSKSDLLEIITFFFSSLILQCNSPYKSINFLPSYYSFKNCISSLIS